MSRIKDYYHDLIESEMRDNEESNEDEVMNQLAEEAQMRDEYRRMVELMYLAAQNLPIGKQF